ncbi:membrane protein [Mycobacterium phage Fefferhead]|nr:membrane protein [Mycobacterium phage Fefferhead]
MNRNMIAAGIGALLAAAAMMLHAPTAAAAPAFCAKHSPTYYIHACAQGTGGAPKPVLCPEGVCEPSESASGGLDLGKVVRGVLGAKPASGGDAGGGDSE